MTTIQVPGPTIVEVNLTGSTWVALGYSDNDNLPSIQFTDHMHEVKTVLSGAVPEELVMQGMEARISVALVRWDQANLALVLADQRGTANVSPVGRRIIGNTAFFGMRVKSAAGTQGYSFTHAFLPNDGIGDSQWGNRERVLTLNFRAIPNPADNVLYSYTT
jgi:hypothetical protein